MLGSNQRRLSRRFYRAIHAHTLRPLTCRYFSGRLLTSGSVPSRFREIHMPSELRRCTRSARRAAGAAELARNHGTAAPEDHANVISLGRVQVDPGHARPADAPEDPSLTVSAMPASDRPHSRRSPNGARPVPVLSGQRRPQNAQFWLGSASPYQASWLVRVPPVLEETALSAAIGVGVAVRPPEPGRDPCRGRRLAGNARRPATRKGKEHAETCSPLPCPCRGRYGHGRF